MTAAPLEGCCLCGAVRYRIGGPWTRSQLPWIALADSLPRHGTIREE